MGLRATLLSLLLLAASHALPGVDDEALKTRIKTKVGEDEVQLGVYHAYLFGVAEYDNLGERQEGNLDAPVKDVHRIARVLKERYAFASDNVHVYPAAADAPGRVTRKQFQTVLEDIGRRDFHEDDHVLIYFAGHGLFHPTDDREFYWLFSDSDPENNYKDCLLGSDLRSALRKIVKPRHVLVLSDSCYSGRLLRGPPPIVAKVDDQYLQKLARGKSFELISSSAGEERAADAWRDGLSLFAWHFVHQLEAAPEKLVPASALWHRVRESVMREDLAAQRPKYGVLRDFEKAGEFMFFHARIEGGVKAGAQVPVAGSPGLPPGYFLPATVAPRSDGVYIDNDKDKAELVLVKGGRFKIGSTTHEVDPFLMDRYEVTVERFEQFLQDRGTPDDLRYWRRKGYSDKSQPVVGVHIQHARAFARWANKRLPSEAEWVYAAGHKQTYAWGEQEPKAMGFGKLRFPPSILTLAKDRTRDGVVGMSSGVRELCLPGRRFDRVGVVRGGTQVLTSRRDALCDPIAFRFEVRADERFNNVGFRCVKDLNQ